MTITKWPKKFSLYGFKDEYAEVILFHLQTFDFNIWIQTPSYLVDAVDLLRWVDHEPTPRTRLHVDNLAFSSHTQINTSKTPSGKSTEIRTRSKAEEHVD